MKVDLDIAVVAINALIAGSRLGAVKIAGLTLDFLFENYAISIGKTIHIHLTLGDEALAEIHHGLSDLETVDDLCKSRIQQFGSVMHFIGRDVDAVEINYEGQMKINFAKNGSEFISLQPFHWPKEMGSDQPFWSVVCESVNIPYLPTNFCSELHCSAETGALGFYAA